MRDCDCVTVSLHSVGVQHYFGVLSFWDLGGRAFRGIGLLAHYRYPGAQGQSVHRP